MGSGGSALEAAVHRSVYEICCEKTQNMNRSINLCIQRSLSHSSLYLFLISCWYFWTALFGCRESVGKYGKDWILGVFSSFWSEPRRQGACQFFKKVNKTRFVGNLRLLFCLYVLLVVYCRELNGELIIYLDYGFTFLNSALEHTWSMIYDMLLFLLKFEALYFI